MIELSRRRLLQGIAAAVAIAPLWEGEARAVGLDAVQTTMEAWSDTIVPGEKRSHSDRAGAWTLMNDPRVGLTPLLTGLAAGLNEQATSYAAGKGIVPDPTVPPFVALEFADRTALAENLLGGSGTEQLVWYALAAMGMLAFHTAAHLDTATAVRQGHPGLAWIRFPKPDADGYWRFPEFSYRRRMAALHPRTTPTGSPA